MHINEADLTRLLHCQHHDPHGHYGWHATEDGAVVRTRQIGAEQVELLIDGTAHPMQPLGSDIWAAHLTSAEPTDYRLRITWPGGHQTELADGYAFLPTLGETDLHLISEGRHEQLWKVLGSHVRSYTTELGEVSGTSFAVWAPNAIGCAVVGDFNGWNASQHPMRALGSTGVWEVFIPGVDAGTVYKYAVQTPEGQRRDKADPLARRAELPPATGSIVVGESDFTWTDDTWLARRAEIDATNAPMSIYEVHLGSWKEGMDYEQLATDLVTYVADQGFTHVEFMPVSEHPFGGSWGYQVSGYYAASSRWGTPDQLRALVNACHERGIGVLIDWVPAHFPKDDWALARFDGRPLYEHPDWRRGEQKDWGTYVFDFGRAEVRNFLVANALYWLEEFHIDGLRVDAVASMLYLDYSRNEGEWAPNQYGGRENLEAVQFLQEMNATVHKLHPGVVTVAEESTSWPGVTAPTSTGGLGFTLKWNMGWMNDTLEYFSLDPIHRSYHHNDITFSMVYQYSEKFILPISHDEVVHGKGTLWTRMPGDTWNKAAGVRTLFAYMWAHPGKNLLFQGQDFAQSREWTEEHSLDWHEFDGWESEYHRGVHRLVRDLNLVYQDSPALYSQDNQPEGFSWAKADDANNNILAFHRYGEDGSRYLCVFNFGGTSQPHYTLGVPGGGKWVRVLNTDDAVYEGAGNDLPGTVFAEDAGWDGYSHRVNLHIPAMSAQWYRLEEE
ncbi:1,4-alpha-glucan branching protein GlgB [Corynebacterium epidermidicanis]|uniref:1,4-alpha-glucan branching enzyme GlgB n=1 Tax=Corynebacterium epidermidicanis TaxID=1050174 RepID=A0A0G3GVL3_9CORY|nr:1,4-alpha-glucan branching protein GlgB [Corynebacterium epidermidicanis]AKK02902.1 alpha-1,4-glucan:alpha-1,4-glucan 6-glycosyltransferase [Corynebacterium epidermidicanis]